MAAFIYQTFSVRPCNPLASVISLRLPVPLHFHSSTALLPFRSPRFHPSFAAMSIQAPKRSPNIAFLDRREAGILHFVEYQGLGNDFILVDNRDSSEPKLTLEQATRICDRNFGVSADGVIFALPGLGDIDYTMRIFNSDGSEPEEKVLSRLGFRFSRRIVAGGLRFRRQLVVVAAAAAAAAAARVCRKMPPTLGHDHDGVTEFSVTGSSSKNILAQASQHADVPLPSAATINVQKRTNFSPATSILDKQIDALKAGAKTHALEAHFNYLKDDGFQSLETIVKCKEAEAKLFQRLANDARREVEGYRQIVRAKSEKLEEYAAKIAKLALQEAEEKRRKKLEELKFLENSHCDYQNMKMRMQAEIAGLLERMEATKKMWA